MTMKSFLRPGPDTEAAGRRLNGAHPARGGGALVSRRGAGRTPVLRAPQRVAAVPVLGAGADQLVEAEQLGTGLEHLDVVAERGAGVEPVRADRAGAAGVEEREVEAFAVEVVGEPRDVAEAVRDQRLGEAGRSVVHLR